MYSTIVVFGFVNNGKTEFCRRLGLSPKGLDALREEKKRGMTIQIGQTYLVDDDRDRAYLILDAPGHAVLTARLISGLNLANVPILIMSCLQTDSALSRLSFYTGILTKYAVQFLVVVLSKIDLVQPQVVTALEKAVRENLRIRDLHILRFHKFMEKKQFIPILLQACSHAHAPAKNYKQTLVLRSFNTNAAMIPLAEMTGAILGTYGTEEYTQGQSWYLTPFKTTKGYWNQPVVIERIWPTPCKLVSTLQTDLMPALAKNNALANSILVKSPVILCNHLRFKPTRIYQKGQEVIITLAHMQMFAKIQKVGKQKAFVDLALLTPVPAPLISYKGQICMRVGYAWELAEMVTFEICRGGL